MLAPRGIATNRKLNLKNSVIVLKCEYCFNRGAFLRQRVNNTERNILHF